MSKEKLSIILFSLSYWIMMPLSAQWLIPESAKLIGQLNNELEAAVDSDEYGYKYTAGCFKGTMDVDPGPGNYSLTSNGGFDMYITKIDTKGKLVWARQIGGLLDDNMYDIEVTSSGMIYATGYFGNIVDFDPGKDSVYIMAKGLQDIFLLKLNQEGELMMIRTMGGDSCDTGKSIALDTNNNIYLTGLFYGTCDFDPGTGSKSLTVNRSYDAFIAKYDSLGSLKWVSQLGTRVGDADGLCIAVDRYANLYCAGYFKGMIDVDPSNKDLLFSNGAIEMAYYLSLDSTGRLNWADRSNICNQFRLPYKLEANKYCYVGPDKRYLKLIISFYTDRDKRVKIEFKS